MKRYAIYRRVSTDEQSRPGHVSLEAQAAECRRAVVERSGVVVAEFEDVQSGLQASRPNYRRLKEAVARGEIDAVIVYRFDRWGREPGEALTACRDLQMLGADVESATEPHNDPFLRGLFFLLGYRESQSISQRTISGLMTRARKGEWSGQPPLGYIVQRENGRSVLAVDPMMAPLIRHLFEEAAESRLSLAQLADRAKAAGLRGRTGHPVSRQAVGRMLRNPTYAGCIVYGRTRNGKFTPRGRRPREEWIVSQDAHPAIIDSATFDRVQAVLSRHRAEQGTVRRTRFLLTSLAYCGRCTNTPGPNGVARAWRVYGHGTKGGGHYECSRRGSYGECDLPIISRAGLDQAVKQRIAAAFDFTSEVRERAADFIATEISERRSAAEQQRRDLARSLEEHNRKRVQLARRLMSNLIPEDVYQALEQEEAAAITLIERTLASLPADPPAANVEPVLAALSIVTWRDLEFEDWRDLAVLLIDRIVIYDRSDFEIEFQPAADVVRTALSKLSGFGSRKLG
ncbi:MAG: hypothetical protein GEU28_14475 [Dehalococcoidia bacterium]|nr:hypothetical protein [Dehalococcoidia bacterium]